MCLCSSVLLLPLFPVVIVIMSGVVRKPSVSISEPASSESVASPTKIPAAGSGNKINPKEIEAQLLKSIPEKERGIVKTWKVKQVVITRLDQGQGAAPSVTGMNVAPAA